MVTFMVTLTLCIACFRHPERQMIFVGDFIDRGPQQREVLRIARSMCDAGAARAVMGNHEFNAIGWAAQDNDGASLRSHSAVKVSTNPACSAIFTQPRSIATWRSFASVKWIGIVCDCNTSARRIKFR